MFSANFVNTAAEQNLRLADLSQNGTNGADQHVCSGDVGSSTPLPAQQ
jgi:hypothetical protein